MKKLLVKQELFSLRDKFFVKDDYGNDAYQVIGSFFALPKHYAILDMSGREVARIERKMFQFLPKYVVYIEGKYLATIEKEFTFFKPRYSIRCKNLDIEGDFWSLNFKVTKNDILIGQVDRQLFKFRDTYEIEIYKENLEIVMLALTISIDCVRAMDRRN